ncbi:MAG: opacity protein-like surface antigen [Bradymonadia bacterium]|jgi:opacity protein-like surface antigen
MRLSGRVRGAKSGQWRGWILGVSVLLIAGTVSAADSVRVAVGDFTGSGSSVRGIGVFQGALKRLGGIGIESTRSFQSEARRMGVTRDLPRDESALIQVSAAVDVDAIIYMEISRSKRRDKVLRLEVYAGRNGRLLGEHDVRVSRGRLTRSVWQKAAKAVEQDLYEALNVRPPPPARRDAPIEMPLTDLAGPRDGGGYDGSRLGGRLDDDPDEQPGAGKMFRIAGGIALLSRSFRYTATDRSPKFNPGGIQYESALVPGFALDAEYYPFAKSQGFAKGFGLQLRFEKVFVNTEQEVQTEAGSTIQALETSHAHFLLRAIYRHRFNERPDSIEVHGGLGFGVLSFQMAENDEYNGVLYQYFDLTIGAYAPLSTQYLAMDVRASVMPAVTLGDTVEELGEVASTFGFRIYAGLASLVTPSVTLTAGFEYTGFNSAITGAGRDGREGETAEDAFVGVRIMGGYRF